MTKADLFSYLAGFVTIMLAIALTDMVQSTHRVQWDSRSPNGRNGSKADAKLTAGLGGKLPLARIVIAACQDDDGDDNPKRT